MSVLRRSVLLSVAAVLGSVLVCNIGCSGPVPATDAGNATAPAGPATADPTMQMHHLHGLMAHGFSMAIEGANLKMLGQMNMTGGVDAVGISHGEAMLGEGRALIDGALNGPVMTALHGATGGSDSTSMTYTHDLGKAMLAVLDQLQQMAPINSKDAKGMALHHMHMALGHAAIMASEGAALKMTAAMKMAGAADEIAATHAAQMSAHARALYDETVNGEAMKAAHAAAGTDAAMTGTHDLGDSINAVIDLLSKMPS